MSKITQVPITIAGKTYTAHLPIPRPAKALYDYQLATAMRARYSPLVEFAAGLEVMGPEAMEAAIGAFVAARRDEEYPEIVRLQVANELAMVKAFAVAMLGNEAADAITEENRAESLKAMVTAQADPELAVIKQIVERRRAQEQPTEPEANNG